jgi:parvulin-like peptidyl-prolyl isomerase
MGYLHRGMLPEAVQDKVDKLKASEVSEPVTTLEGVVLIRVDDRKSARPREFEDVRERAQQLWQREEGERAWRAYLAQLRTKARIQVVDASRYPPAPVTGDKGDALPIAPQAAPRAAE